MSYQEPGFPLDTATRASGTISHPRWELVKRNLKKGDQMKYNGIYPDSNIFNITSENNSVKINDVVYSIAEGRYNITTLLQAFSTAVTGFTFSFNDKTTLITITNDATTNFVLTTNKFLGFTLASYIGKSTYTASVVCLISPRMVCLCSNLSNLFVVGNYEHKRDRTFPPDLLDSMTIASPGRDFEFKSEWITISREMELSEIDFHWIYSNNLTKDVQINADWGVTLTIKHKEMNYAI